MGLFDNDSGDDDKCPVYNLNEVAEKKFVANLTFQQFNRILAGACAALACLVSFAHMFWHATHFSVPRQQTKILRIIALVPLYAITNVLIICFPTAEVYINPCIELIQALVLASYFMLICEFISPHVDGQSGFWAQIEIKDKKAEGGVVQDGVKWFGQRCFAIFQYPVAALGVVIATIITQLAHVYCQYESTTKYAKLWLSLVMTLSSGLAISSILVVAIQLKIHMPNLKPVHKLVAIKLVVGLSFLQSILFWILQSTHVLKPSATLTYADLHYGIPSLLSCCEMALICWVVLWAYPVGPYKLKNLVARGAERGEDNTYAPSSYQGGPLGIFAFFEMINPFDVIKATFAAFAVAARSYGDRNNNANDKLNYSPGPSYQRPSEQYSSNYGNGAPQNNGGYQPRPGYQSRPNGQGGQSRMGGFAQAARRGPIGLAGEAFKQFGPGRNNYGNNGGNNNDYGRPNGREGYDHARGNSYPESYPMNQRR